MPKRQDHNNAILPRRRIAPTDPGYGWIPEKFGPSPGIPREEKEDLDAMSDKDFVSRVLDFGAALLYSLMISEAERRRTFRCTWKYDHVVKGRELARVGFYSLNSGDLVKCVFCQCEIQNWTHKMDPLIQHKKKSPFCEYVTGKALHNIPVDDATISTASVKNRSIELIHKHPEYSKHSERLATFDRFSSQLLSLAHKFSDAGFFLNSDESVVCHSCGLVLDQEWGGDEIAWVLHSQWKPDCPFLIENLGCSYISRVGGYRYSTIEGRQEKPSYDISYRV